MEYKDFLEKYIGLRGEFFAQTNHLILGQQPKTEIIYVYKDFVVLKTELTAINVNYTTVPISIFKVTIPKKVKNIEN